MVHQVKQALDTHLMIKGLTQVTMPWTHTVGASVTINTKAEVELACLAEVGRWFIQVWQTPFLQPPLVQEFCEITVDKLTFMEELALVDTFCSPSACNPNMAKLLHNLQWPPNVADHVTKENVEDFNKGWCIVWEQTSSLPLKVHFGHYMASTFNPDIAAIINAKMAQLPQLLGRPLKCWKKGLTEHCVRENSGKQQYGETVHHSPIWSGH